MTSILVTGGTGSFGHAFVHRMLQQDPAPQRLVIFSRDEQKQDVMAREFNHDALRFFIGDVRDHSRLELAMRDIDVVVHAAALKIIPSCEYNPFEAVQTNIMGAQNVVRAALRTGVKQVVGLSTDKACSPLNLYGATKLAAEKIFIASNALSGGRCHFSMVRYGNVVGSRGSVIPLFKTLALAKKPIPITDAAMTRFSLSLDAAVDLVLHALATMTGREIFVPRIPSYRITDLAAAIAPGSPTIVVGIRPGEKLHETLITKDEARMTHAEALCYVIRPDRLGEMPDGFVYESNSNPHFLSVSELMGLR